MEHDHNLMEGGGNLPRPRGNVDIGFWLLVLVYLRRLQQNRQQPQLEAGAEAEAEAEPAPAPAPAPAPRRRRQRRRRYWVSPLLREQRRFAQGWYANLMREMQLEEVGDFRNFMRITPDMFQELLEGIRPAIQKRDTNYRKCIPPEIRLAATLRYLATGCSTHDLKYGFRLGRSTATTIIAQTCAAIIDVFMDRFVVTPADTDGWRAISEQFATKWNFEHALGAIDGKHIHIRKPRSAGSAYFNYKKFHSIILLAICDANYKFIYVSAGARGRAGDAGIYQDSELKQALESGELPIPPPEPLPHDVSGKLTTYFFIGDDAFGCTKNMLKPINWSRRRSTWANEVFNYRLSRARRVVENAFGVLSHRFRVLLGTIQQEPKVAADIVVACCVLHNYLCDRRPEGVPAMPALIR